MNDGARLEALEFKCAHPERAVQELSDVLYQQSRRLDETVLRNEQLKQQLELIESRGGEPATEAEIPPHY